MEKINKENLKEFTKYYHGLHDSYITNINYNIEKEKIELYIDVCWSGEPTLKDDGYYETNKTKIKMLFNKVYNFNMKEFFSWNYINNIYLKYIILENKEMLCFATDEAEPLLYIVCDNIEYEEIF